MIKQYQRANTKNNIGTYLLLNIYVDTYIGVCNNIIIQKNELQ